MTGLAHPLEDVLGSALVEAQSPRPRPLEQDDPRRDGWFWMITLVTAIGLLAWATR